VALPEDYWESFEIRIASVAEYVEAVRLISAYGAETGSKFAWRGVARADWPLHSALFRRHVEANSGSTPTEHQLHRLEMEIFEEAREWSLDWHSSGGRLSALELFAALQHYEAPTRLLDFTFNAMVALWFAAEKEDAYDGRVFAIDVSDQLVTQENAAASAPWWSQEQPDEWKARSWAWRPPPFEARIVRQDGCFLVGGVPSTEVARSVYRDGHWRPLRAHEVRKCMSLPFRLISFEQAEAAAKGERVRGRQPKARSFTVRVGEKDRIREDLKRGFAYSYSSIYPDFPGFAKFGSSIPARP
jgi:FRG domain